MSQTGDRPYVSGRRQWFHWHIHLPKRGEVFLEDSLINVAPSQVLRFVSEFVDLFDIAPTKTRVSFIQYSEQIRHEFNFDTYQTKSQIEQVVAAPMTSV